MAGKQLLFRSAAREKVLSGATALADAVRITLGPKSKCVLIQKKWGRPIVCNDGITIAKEIELEDPEANLGAQMIREAAERTGEAVGDGTSTSAILAHAIFAEGLHNVAAGASAVDLKRGLDRGLIAAVKALRGLSRPVAAARKRHRLPPYLRTTIRPRANWLPMRTRRWGLRVSSPSRNRRLPNPPWRLWKACNLIGDISRRIS